MLYQSFIQFSVKNNLQNRFDKTNTPYENNQCPFSNQVALERMNNPIKCHVYDDYNWMTNMTKDCVKELLGLNSTEYY